MSQTKIEISNLSDSVISALAVPKITSITYPGDDTAANPTGGQQITLTGSGFSAGAIVNIAGVPVAVSSVVNSNTIAFTSPAKATGSYALSVINTDGGIAVSVTNIEYSGVPAWSTPAGTLGTLYETDPLSAQLTAVSDSAVTYAVTSGLLPAGTSLNSATGALTGATSTVVSSTTYSFTVDAVDAEQQNTSRNFSATVNPDAVTWNSPANETTYTNVTGDVFSQVLSATSAAGKTISYSANALPSGLSITGSTISGTFSAATTSASLITATAATTNKTATRTLNWSVVPLVPMGKLYSLGWSSLGATATGFVYPISLQQVGSLTNWTVATARGYVGAAIKSDGTLWTWGNNGNGQLGLNNTIGVSSPNQVGALTNWLTVAAANYHIIAIKTNGTLWTWGGSGNGQLGQNDTISRSSPVQVGTLNTWKTLATGLQAWTMAIKTDGTLWSWGRNSYGQLGHGDTMQKSSPIQVGTSTDWALVSGGEDFSIGRTTGGYLLSWGRNHFGQLGNNYFKDNGIYNTANRTTPGYVGSNNTWNKIYGGDRHVVATKTDGTMWSWGLNNKGQLGLSNVGGYQQSWDSPKQVGALTTWLTPAAGNAHSAALKTDGTFWQWGTNYRDILGIGVEITSISSPAQVGSLTTWIQLAAGDAVKIAIAT